MLRPMLLVLLELENSLSRAVRMEQASVCCGRRVKSDTEVKPASIKTESENLNLLPVEFYTNIFECVGSIQCTKTKKPSSKYQSK